MRYFRTLLVLSIFLIILPVTAWAAVGKYTEQGNTEIESAFGTTCGDTTQDYVCHLRDYAFPTSNIVTADGSTGSATSFNDETKAGVTHPGANRGPASFYSEWIHQQHGGTQWPVNDYDGGPPSTKTRYASPPATAETGNNQGNFDQEVTSRYGTASGQDFGFRRTYYEVGRDDTESWWWDDTDPAPWYYIGGVYENAKVYMNAPCAYGAQTSEVDLITHGDGNSGSGGCHGITSYGGTTTREDTIACTKCHQSVTVTSTYGGHGTAGNNTDNCFECHHDSASADNLGDTFVPKTKNCWECHSGVVTPINTTGGHAGKDCRECHGHGHDITNDESWGVSCGKDDANCHSSGTYNMGFHNSTASGPNCVDCHVPAGQKAHNTTIPSCSQCHNSTSNWGGAITSSQGLIPGWDSSNYYHGDNSQGNGLTCGYADCHNKGSGWDHTSGVSRPAGCVIASTCHSSGGSIGTEITETHSNLSCTSCHNNNTINSLTSASAVTINTNFHSNALETTGANMTPFAIPLTGITTDAECLNCHDQIGSSGCNTGGCHQSYDIHRTAMGVTATRDGSHGAGGSNCTNCHDTGGSNAYMDFSSVLGSIHYKINNATDGSPNYEERRNRPCQGCHVTGGLESSHYNQNPLTCWDCHNGTRAYPDVSNAPVVSQHYKFGALIQAATDEISNNASCLVCHNKSVMLNTFTEDDQGKTGFNKESNVSHYGKRRWDMRIISNGNNVTNCLVCHQDPNNPFIDAFDQKPNLVMVFNHTNTSSGPACWNSTCHNEGLIHDAALTIPVFDTTLCTTTGCHGDRLQHGADDLANVADTNTFNCTECHTQTASNVHGINQSYLRQDNTFGAKNLGVNCSTCHQFSNVDGNFDESAPKVPQPFNHSNGSKWGNTYWSTTSEACDYCHYDTRHNSTALGNVSAGLTGNNHVNGTINTTSQWCAGCHIDAYSGYYGDLLTPAPPDIKSTGANWPSSSMRYDHTSMSGTSTDNECQGCHGANLGSSPKMDEFMHSVSLGANGGANCSECHDSGKTSGGGFTVNFSAINSSLGIHADLNNPSVTFSAGIDKRNAICWACHASDGLEPAEHPDRQYNPKTCLDCHDGTGTYGELTVTNHYRSGTNISSSSGSSDDNASCINCHQNSAIPEMRLTGVNDNDYASNAEVYGTGSQGSNNSASHYGKKRTDIVVASSYTNCSYCHQNSTSDFISVMSSSVKASISLHTDNSGGPYCNNTNCHSNGRIHDSALQIPYTGKAKMYNSSLCMESGCHATKEVHALSDISGVSDANTQECADCHANPNAYAGGASGTIGVNANYDEMTKNDSTTITGYPAPSEAKVGDPAASILEFGSNREFDDIGPITNDAYSLVTILQKLIATAKGLTGILGALLSTLVDSGEVGNPSMIKDVSPPIILDTAPDVVQEASDIISEIIIEEAAVNEIGGQPEFDINIMDNGGNIVTSLEADTIDVSLVMPDGEEVSADNLLKKAEEGYKFKMDKGREFQPGKYTMKVETVVDGETVVQEQDFTWGVLAINTHKSVYQPGEEAFISIGVLDNLGVTVCDAEVTLEITSPSGEKSILSTIDSTIVATDPCTNGQSELPDYYGYYSVDQVGAYKLVLRAVIEDGLRELVDGFTVKSSVPFDVERNGPTRIDPIRLYDLEFIIKANQDYSGPVIEYVPASFEITPQEGLSVSELGDTKLLEWSGLELLEGETYSLSYEFDAPDIYPDFFTLGTLMIGSWSEERQWQIANDKPGKLINSDFLITDASITQAGPGTTTATGSFINDNGGGDPEDWVVFIEDSTLSAITNACGANDIRITSVSAGLGVFDTYCVTNTNGFSCTALPDLGDIGTVTWNIEACAAGSETYNLQFTTGTGGQVGFTSTDTLSVTAANTPPSVSTKDINVTAANINENICLTSDITDDVSISLVYSEIQWSNGTNVNLTMVDDGSSCDTTGSDGTYSREIDVGSTTGYFAFNATYAQDGASAWGSNTSATLIPITVDSPPSVSALAINVSSAVIDENICLTADVSDDGTINTVYSEITWPNATNVNLTMVDDGSSCDTTGSDGTYSREVDVGSDTGNFVFDVAYAQDDKSQWGADSTSDSITISSGAVTPPLFNSPTSVGEMASWTSSGNALASNNSYASTSTDLAAIIFSNFGFSIPGGKTITNVSVGIETYGTEDIGVNVSWDGGSTWATQQVKADVATTDPNSYAWFSFTSATTWDETKLNDANFRVRVSHEQQGGAGTNYIDHVNVTVDWTDLSSAKDVYRHYLKFDVSGVAAGANIDTANLSLYVTNIGSGGNFGRINYTAGDYTSATADTTVHTTSLTSAGAVITMPASASWINVSITDIVQAAVDAGRVNVTMQIRTADETNSTQNFNITASSGGANEPYLYVAYSPNPQKQIHGIRYIQQDGTYSSAFDATSAANCTSCHQGSTIASINNTGVPKVSSLFNHSNGSKWNSASPYWSTTTGACQYCHYDSKHNATGLGNASLGLTRDSGNIVNSSNSGTNVTQQWCAGCHVEGFSGYYGSTLNPAPPTIKLGTTYYPSSSMRYDHSSAVTNDPSDNSCFSCHGGGLASTVSMDIFMHNVSYGVGGGPNCTSCHDNGGSAPNVNIDVVLTSVHGAINNATEGGLNYEERRNRVCRGCHEPDGKENGHADYTSNDAYKCWTCHDGAAPFSNVSNAPTVSEHFLGGTDITATGAASNNESCLQCHNKTEMLNTFTEDDHGSSGASIEANVSHYGKRRWDLRRDVGGTNVTDCLTCHQSSSTGFADAMNEDSTLVLLNNHTNQSTGPTCWNSTCHGEGRIHDDALGQPTFAATLCNTTGCHGTKLMHGEVDISGVSDSNTFNCTDCHTQTGRNIHGINNTYLQQDASYSSDAAANVVNCTTCHIKTTVDGQLSVTAPKISNTQFNHSNGTKWGFTYWNNQDEACEYCHGDTKHNSTAMGNASQGLSDNGNIINGSVNSTQQWCLGCHFEIYPNYYGDSLSPVPPAIWDSGSYFPAASAAYNHTTVSATPSDSDCFVCHSSNVASDAKMDEFMHNTALGLACDSCHGYPPNGNIQVGVFGWPNREGSITADSGTNPSRGAHNLHSNTSELNIDCSNCHPNPGSSGHDDNSDPANKSFGGSWSFISTVTVGAYSNTSGNDSLTQNASCANVNCHIRNLGYQATWGNATWGQSRDNCTQCHGVDNTGQPGSGLHDYHVNTQSKGCSECHNYTSPGAPAHKNGSTQINITYDSASGSCLTPSCHTTGLNDATSYSGISADWNQTGTGNCSACHSTPARVSGLPAQGKHVLHNETEGKSCTDCHLHADGTTGHFNTTVDFNTSANFDGTDSCTTPSCHVSSLTDSASYSGIKANWSQSGVNNCSACHSSKVTGLPTQGKHVLHNETEGKPCTDCHLHADGTTGHFNTSVDFNTSANFDGSDSCSAPSCHVSSLTDSASYSGISATWSQSGVNNCSACHSLKVTGLPTQGKHVLHNETEGKPCTDCHLHADGTTGHFNTSVDFNTSANFDGSDSCSAPSCHVSSLTDSASYNGISATWSQSGTGNCTACHATPARVSGLPAQGKHVLHNETEGKPCTDCHLHADGTTGHFNTSVDFNTSANFDGSDSCTTPSCHVSSLTDSASYSGISATWSQSGTGNCTACHATPARVSGLPAQGKHVLHNETEGKPCTDCHLHADGTTGHFNTSVDFNTSANFDGSDSCTTPSCHVSSLTDSASYSGISAIWSQSGTGNCSACHSSKVTGLPTQGKHVLHNETEGKPCTDCHLHADGTTGHFNTSVDFNTSANFDGSDTCGGPSCHVKNLDAASYAGISAQWSQATTGNCTACHSTNSSGWPAQGPHDDHMNTARLNLTDGTTQIANCTSCHLQGSEDATHTGHFNGSSDVKLVSGGSFNSGTNNCTNACHAGAQATWTSTATIGCKDCHDAENKAPTANKDVADSFVDYTTMTTIGIHSEVNGASAADAVCTACHNSTSAMTDPIDYKANSSTLRNCSYCHTSPIQYSAPLVSEHIPSANDINTSIMGCMNCHDNADASMITTSLSSGATFDNNYSYAHYINNVTYLTASPYTHNAVNTASCTICHIDNGAYVLDTEWGTPWNASNPGSSPAGYPGTWRDHNETLDSECSTCHGSVTTTDFHQSILSAGTSCDGCHGSPPNKDLIKGHPQREGSVVADDGTTAQRGAHYLHGNNTQLDISCVTCHTPPIGGGGHDDDVIPANITFSGTYISQAVSATYNNSQGNTTLDRNATCADVSCHIRNLGYKVTWGNATWGQARDNCTQCHGVDNTGQPGSGLHNFHVNTKGQGCSGCHNYTVPQATAHKNGSTQINVTYDSISGSCLAPSCHTNGLTDSASYSSISADWNQSGTGNCSACHSTPARVSGLPAQGKHVLHNETEGKSCTDCHLHADGTTGHFNTTVDFNTSSKFDGSDSCSAPSCHVSSLTDSASYNGISATWSQSGTGNCTACHATPARVSGLPAQGKHVLHNETEGKPCTDCHLHADGTTGHFNTSVDFNTSASFDGGDSCSAPSCHTRGLTDSASYNGISATWSQSGVNNCSACHSNRTSGLPSQGKHVYHNETKGKVCTDCHLHADGTTGHFNTSVDFNTSANFDGADTCAGPSCHVQNLDASSYADISSRWSQATTGNCTACHSTNSSGWPAQGAHDDHMNTARLNLTDGSTQIYNCTSCHPQGSEDATHTEHFDGTSDVSLVSGGSYSSATNNCTNACHAGQQATWTSTATIGCKDCHSATSRTPSANKDVADSFVDYTTMTFIGIHSEVGDTGATDTVCMSCHNATGGMRAATDFTVNTTNIQNCTDCHTGAGQYGAPIVSEHIPSATDVNTSAMGCMGCHDNADASMINTSLSSGATLDNNYSYAHYVNNVTYNLSTPYMHNAVNTTLCTICHIDNGAYVEDPEWGTPWNASNPSSSPVGYPGTWRDHNETTDATCSGCHGDVSNTDFHADNLGPGVAGGSNCTDCHRAGDSGSYPDVDHETAITSAHGAINNATDGSPTWDERRNKVCRGCHEPDGKENGHADYTSSNAYKCYDCHDGTAPYTNVSNAPVVSEHFKGGSKITAATDGADNSESCTVCHNQAAMLNTFTEDDSKKTGNGTYSNVSHYAKTRWDLRITPNGNNVTDCLVCHQDGANAFIDAFDEDPTLTYVFNHTNSSSGPACWNSTCHAEGKLHDATITIPTFQATLCNTTGCHATRQMHGEVDLANVGDANTFNCTDCHTQTGRNIHGINQTYLRQDATYGAKNAGVNCTTCHQKTTVDSELSITAPKIPSYFNHSNGSKWGNTYWTTQDEACDYCHGDTKHNSTAMGNVSAGLKGNNHVNGSINSTSKWCAGCHVTTSSVYFGDQLEPVPPGIRSTGSYYPSSSMVYDHETLVGADAVDSDCDGCHGANLGSSPKIDEFMHNVALGVGGGPNCTSCHDNGGSSGWVNFSVIISSIHGDINNATEGGIPGYERRNRVCRGCHEPDGKESGHADYTSNDAYKCWDCHNGTAPYSNVSNAPTVSEHFYSGSDIPAANSSGSDEASCISCHNLAEMLNDFTEDDTGSTGDGNYSNISHYGKKRFVSGDGLYTAGGYSNCSYCHQNTSTVFSGAMANVDFKDMYDHSNQSTGPTCANVTCHGSARLHDSTLTKPAGGQYDNTLCTTQGCHGAKEVHGVGDLNSNTLDCASCHINGSASDKQIHGVRYIGLDGLYTSSPWRSGSIANCSTCHQGSVSGNSINGTSIPQVANPMYHSDNESAGNIWGAYWNDADSDKTNDSCWYCHGDTKHNSTALGIVNTTRTTYNIVNGTISSTGTWCASCHYNLSSDYMGDQFSVEPPEIRDPALYSKQPGYFFNHTDLDSFNDTKCQSCHAISGNSKMDSLMHNVGKGLKSNCTSCHYSGSPIVPAGKDIDVTAFNASIHKNLNSEATTSSRIPNSTSACWACHNAGSDPGTTHDTATYLSPRGCSGGNGDCHVSGRPGFEQFQNAFNVSKHTNKSSEVIAPQSCLTCHNRSIYNATTIAVTVETANENVSHYGTTSNLTVGSADSPTTDCIGCHVESSWYSSEWSATNINGSGHITTSSSAQGCLGCHTYPKAASVNNFHDYRIGSVSWGGGCGQQNCHG